MAKKVPLDGSAVTDIAYPTGTDLTGESIDLIQAFDRVFLFRDGARTLEWRTPLGREITGAERASNVVTIDLPSHGLTVGDSQ